MKAKMLMIFLSLLCFSNSSFVKAGEPVAENCICGKWESSEKNLIVQVYKDNNTFKAKIVWFDPTGSNQPMEEWTDVKNPNETLRNRKVLGMNVLQQLRYHADTNSWEDGMIYDAKNGREWNASAYIAKTGELKVKGYWHVKFIGKTLTFYRV